MFMKDKESYLAPEVEVLVVHNEGVICASDFGEPGSPGGGAGHGGGGSY